MTKDEKENQVIKLFKEYKTQKQPILREWRLIRSLYNGDFWKVFKKNLKDFTLTPDWNYFDYTVQAYLNSIYSGAFIGTLTPVHAEDTQAIQSLNSFLAYNWNKWGMKNKFLHVGENGELYNVGAVRVDWKDNDIKLEALSPDEIYFDPSVSNYKEGQAVFIERSININILRDDSRFSDKVKKYISSHSKLQDRHAIDKLGGREITTVSNNTTVSIVEGFVRNESNKIEQFFILEEDTVIYSKELTISKFPIAVYTPNRPDGNPYGHSRLLKILNTVIVLNTIDSMEATQPYRILNRPRFINVDGRCNMRAFAKYGNTPGASFEVQGDPNNLVRYVDVPTIPDMSALKARLENSIFQITGVDPYYKGRMTNSIQTTGATQAFQARVTMLTDNARITLLEEFCEDLTRIVLDFYNEYGSDHTYHVPTLSATGTNAVVDEQQITFNKTPYDYHINASVLLPMNQANLFESAKALYEMQGQYGFKTPVITEEDLIRYSDFPQKDLILQRISQDKQSNSAQDLIADLTNFATIFTKLLAKGLSEEQAAEQAISMLIEEKNAMMQNPNIGQGLQ